MTTKEQIKSYILRMPEERLEGLASMYYDAIAEFHGGMFPRHVLEIQLEKYAGITRISEGRKLTLALAKIHYVIFR